LCTAVEYVIETYKTPSSSASGTNSTNWCEYRCCLKA
jgi:hypothetical protein